MCGLTCIHPFLLFVLTLLHDHDDLRGRGGRVVVAASLERGRHLVAVLDQLHLENTEAELESRRKHVDGEAAEGDDPAPGALGVVVLAERGRFPVTSEGCKKIFVNCCNNTQLISRKSTMENRYFLSSLFRLLRLFYQKTKLVIF